VLHINLKNIQLADKAIFDRYFVASQHHNSECTFTYHYMWRKAGNVKWAIVDDCLCILHEYHNGPFFFPPYGATDDNIATVLKEMAQYFSGLKKPLQLRGLTAPAVELLSGVFPERFSFTMNRDACDYIYLGTDLRDLRGRQYTKKRNHINAFMREHPDFNYYPMAKTNIPQCLEFADQWFNNHENTYFLPEEKAAISDIMETFEDLALTGAVIEIDGKVEAFTIGESINKEVAVVHIEKANSAIRGLYPAINQEFCKRAWGDKLYINREEDMGIASLRKAKQSYYPHLILEKFSAIENSLFNYNQANYLKKCSGLNCFLSASNKGSCS
jgi:uncharacterized protein